MKTQCASGMSASGDSTPAVNSPFPPPAAVFADRHIGPGIEATRQMLEVVERQTLDALIDEAVPARLRLAQGLSLPPAAGEFEVLAKLRELAGQNQVYRNWIGLGYYDAILPPVIQRNVLENPGWYTQYTPYQAEIAQGRLEALLNFQTMVCDLTGLPIANASLLDEATAAAEAMTMCHGLRGRNGAHRFWVSQSCFPQTIAVLRTRARFQGIEIVVGDHRQLKVDESVFGILVQYPAEDGAVYDYQKAVEQAHAAGAMVVVAADLLSLTLLRAPGEWGADIAVGSTQRFGLPLGYGGPHAAFFATREVFKRQMPGRLVGVSKDAQGRPALRLALQTREQHIRREKATSNICTAQVLPAILASMFAVYHGPDGLRGIARRIHALTAVLAAGLRRLGHQVAPGDFFDTLRVAIAAPPADEVVRIAAQHRVNLRFIDERTLGISLGESASGKDIEDLWRIFNQDRPADFGFPDLAAVASAGLSGPFVRQSAFLQHPVFNRYHCETEMLRYLHRLESKDLSLTTSMIPLGSCTMKLNAAAEMLPLTWPEFGALHPFAPADQAGGYHAVFAQLEGWLAAITGFVGVSLQPNAGAAGEYAGLCVIRAYHEHHGQGHRRICLIPQSAHGTNPASAVMAGLNVVTVACDAEGNIDLADLRAKAAAHRPDLAALMVTYPSTHGVFEEGIQEVCRIIHEQGGQVYMDGANMNAQVGLCRPADMGADVCHINLHKTFCIPHGGGGPGMGPICVAAHLAAFLPGHPFGRCAALRDLGPVAAAPWGSASILTIPWVYISLMGAEGLARATKMAILNANYIAKRLDPFFPVLYKGQGGLVAHECILDFRSIKQVTVEDVAKRLMDYGFHAPTVSWPVHDTLMVEPTESESKEELDRFCEAMIAIHAEIKAIESGQADAKDNPLKNAPHTAEAVSADQWGHPYSRQQAAYPAPWLREFKFWPAVGRIDNVYGDRNPVCTCAGL